MPIAAYTLDGKLPSPSQLFGHSFQLHIPDIFDLDSITDIDPRSLIPRPQEEPSANVKSDEPMALPEKVPERRPVSTRPSGHKRKRESTDGLAEDSGVYLDPPKKKRCKFDLPTFPSSRTVTMGSLSRKENRTIDLNSRAKKLSRVQSLWRPPPADSRLVLHHEPRKRTFEILPDPDAPRWRDDTRGQHSSKRTSVEPKVNQRVSPGYIAAAPAASRSMWDPFYRFQLRLTISNPSGS